MPAREGAPPAPAAPGCGFRARSLACRRPHGKGFPHGREVTALHVCGSKGRRSPRPPADKGCPGTRVLPTGTLRVGQNQPVARTGKNTGSGPGCWGELWLKTKSPCLFWLSLGNDSPKGAPCPPLQHPPGEIILGTDTVLRARAAGWRPCRPALEGSGGGGGGVLPAVSQAAGTPESSEVTRLAGGTPAAEGLAFYSRSNTTSASKSSLGELCVCVFGNAAEMLIVCNFHIWISFHLQIRFPPRDRPALWCAWNRFNFPSPFSFFFFVHILIFLSHFFSIPFVFML